MFSLPYVRSRLLIKQNEKRSMIIIIAYSVTTLLNGRPSIFIIIANITIQNIELEQEIHDQASSAMTKVE